jgi:recombination protein RecA
VIFTNQLREKVGIMFGNPETTPGGRALKFYSSVRLDIRRIETLKDGVEAFGNRVRVKVVTKSGSYFSFGDERLGQGRQNATAFLREHPDVTQQILQLPYCCFVVIEMRL